MAEKLLVGKINGVYGVKGWVKVYSYTEPSEQILNYLPWYLKKGAKQHSVKVVEGKKQGKGLVALTDGIEDRTQAEELIGSEIWVDKDQLPNLEKGDYYWHQLEGLEVFNEAGEFLGEVSHLFETGANDVLVVKASEKSIDDMERLIPYVEKEIVLEIDLEERRILVAWGSDL
ncbi:MAG: ribosome maturation factor RimM [Pseudomonadales bacterium]|nr:ribosome maturation factor RimM [Gammaproteobacteria bacterium]MDP6025924.1 ribosome maturation factor RimM [Pseudomonadales bacterium]MDP6316787.1 ribosome maturation factor RimM [Pseudomonadales bacterium]MDP7314599.1 ribosome maturation factor RimM [Pseudomonadales bacterium]MDP7575557.1 ribosome maturation factor RimM [Pseudomonadales bacterium]